MSGGKSDRPYTKKSTRATDRRQMAAGGRNFSGHGSKSATVRERAILALLSETTISRAAAECGIGERTLRRWTTDDERFKRELAQARHAMFQSGLNRVQALTVVAVDTLAALMAPKVPPNVRLGAARTVVELGLHQHDTETILRKVEAIEALQRQFETTGRQ